MSLPCLQSPLPFLLPIFPLPSFLSSHLFPFLLPLFLSQGKSSAQYLCCGRLVLDVKISARELIRCRSYDLSELVNTVLSETYQPWDEEKVVGSFR